MTDNSDLNRGKVRAVGVGIREGERAALDEIAAQYGISRNSLMLWAVRWFIVQHRAGKVDLSKDIIEPRPIKKQLTLPE